MATKNKQQPIAKEKSKFTRAYQKSKLESRSIS